MAQSTTEPVSSPLPETAPRAVVSLVLGLLWIFGIGSIFAVTSGHIALKQIRSGRYRRGSELAVAGLVLGYVGLLGVALVLLQVVVLGAHAKSEFDRVQQQICSTTPPATC